MSKNYPQILHAPDEADRLASAELAWYRSSRLGAIDDQEIQEIISNL